MATTALKTNGVMGIPYSIVSKEIATSTAFYRASYRAPQADTLLSYPKKQADTRLSYPEQTEDTRVPYPSEQVI